MHVNTINMFIYLLIFIIVEVCTAIIILIILIDQVNCFFFAPTKPASCPPQHLFFPCECYLHGDSTRIIRCGGTQLYDLYHVFETLSTHLQENEKHFDMFYFNNTAIDLIGDVLHDITFDYICMYFFLWIFIITLPQF